MRKKAYANTVKRLSCIVCVVMCLCIPLALSQSMPSLPTVYSGTLNLNSGDQCLEDTIEVYDESETFRGTGKIILSSGTCMYSLGIQTDALTHDEMLTIRAQDYYQPATILFSSLDQDDPSLTLSRNEHSPPSETDAKELDSSDASEIDSSDTQTVTDSSQEPFVPWYEKSAEKDSDNDDHDTDAQAVDNADHLNDTHATRTDNASATRGTKQDTRSFIPLKNDTNQEDSSTDTVASEKKQTHASASTSTTEQTDDITTKRNAVMTDENDETIELVGHSFDRTTLIVSLVVFLVVAYGSGVLIALRIMR